MAVARAKCGYMCLFDPQPTLYKSHASGESRLWPSCICHWPYLYSTDTHSSLSLTTLEWTSVLGYSLYFSSLLTPYLVQAGPKELGAKIQTLDPVYYGVKISINHL